MPGRSAMIVAGESHSGSDPKFVKKGSDPNSGDRHWVRGLLGSPVAWLAFGLFAASIAGCVVTIMLALGQPGGELPDVGERVLKVPAVRVEEGP